MLISFLADENSNGFQRPGQNSRRPLSNYDNCNNGVKQLGNIPGQINVSKHWLETKLLLYSNSP